MEYYKTNGILALEKHVDAKHNLLGKKLDQEVNSSKKIQVEKNQPKRMKMYFIWNF